MRHQLTTLPGFNYQGYLNASQYTLQANTHLDQGLEWAGTAISMPFIGQANFMTLSNKAQILTQMGREPEAATLMQQGLKLPGTTPIEIHSYARQLQAAKKTQEAIAVFKMNAVRNGDVWPTHVGLARAYAAEGDIPKALEHARKALDQAPDPVNKQSLEGMVQIFSQGRNIEQ